MAAGLPYTRRCRTLTRTRRSLATCSALLQRRLLRGPARGSEAFAAAAGRQAAGAPVGKPLCGYQSHAVVGALGSRGGTVAPGLSGESGRPRPDRATG